MVVVGVVVLLGVGVVDEEVVVLGVEVLIVVLVVVLVVVDVEWPKQYGSNPLHNKHINCEMKIKY